MAHSVRGLEDASKYPDLVAEMIARGWKDDDIIGLIGGNLIRVMDAVDAVALELADHPASSEIYEERTDLPAPSNTWGQYLPDVVKQYLADRARK